ncbi:Xaa-Pro dipeptidase [Spirochaetia bacterium]|nr:Xaa-Pro dipeptidase [Spirochaetia bacterium]
MGFAERREKLYEIMSSEKISLVMFEDNEKHRDQSIRWLTGHPGDALLFMNIVDKTSVLVPWDVNMATSHAVIEKIIPYTNYSLDSVKALKGIIGYFKLPVNCRIELPLHTPYIEFLNYVEFFSDYDVLCRKEGAAREVDILRSIKDDDEIKNYRVLSSITNNIIDLIEEQVGKGILKTESDVALFIESECRKNGCEGTGFTTLAAGEKRSFGIHAFPPYTAGPFAGKGLSILDFGVVLNGYTSDVTMTFACGHLTKKQELQLKLVQEAFDIAVSKMKPGTPARSVALAVENHFKKAKLVMPHGLGHGIGLQAHEEPFVRTRSDKFVTLEPGMIFTIEPGLYDPDAGGCRYENDVLLTETGPEMLTKSKIVRL